MEPGAAGSRPYQSRQFKGCSDDQYFPQAMGRGLVSARTRITVGGIRYEPNSLDLLVHTGEKVRPS